MLSTIGTTQRSVSCRTSIASPVQPYIRYSPEGGSGTFRSTRASTPDSVRFSGAFAVSRRSKKTLKSGSKGRRSGTTRVTPARCSTGTRNGFRFSRGRNRQIPGSTHFRRGGRFQQGTLRGDPAGQDVAFGASVPRPSDGGSSVHDRGVVHR